MLPLKRTHYCTELSLSNVDEEVIVTGWVQKRRDHGGVIFIDLRDREGTLQVVFNEEKLPAEQFAAIESASCDSASGSKSFLG